MSHDLSSQVNIIIIIFGADFVIGYSKLRVAQEKLALARLGALGLSITKYFLKVFVLHVLMHNFDQWITYYLCSVPIADTILEQIE
jgi:hypothetical protein